MNLRYMIDFQKLEIIMKVHFIEIGILLPLPDVWN